MNQRDLPPPSQRSAPSRPDQVRERLRDAVIARMLPLLGELQAAVEAELRRHSMGEAPSAQVADDLTGLAIMRRHAMLYEGRWKACIAAAFNAFPEEPAAETDQYALISENELQSQLVGQPVIEALDRRFADILDVLDSRLWDFALRLSGRGEAISPVAPRMFVEALLRVYPASECSPSLHQALLRHYLVLAGDQLGDFYTWFNAELSEAGFAMSRYGRHALQGAVSADSFDDAGIDNDRRSAARTRRRVPGVAGELGAALRQRLRLQRMRHERTISGSARRVLSEQEFLAVLSLVQADYEQADHEQTDLEQADLEQTGDQRTETGTQASAQASGLAQRLREALILGAAKLGLDPTSAAMSLPQEDAIDLVGTLFQGLIGQHDFHVAARRWLAQMAFAYVHLVLRDPELLDDGDDPAIRLLAELVVVWDGTARGGELHAAGERACRAIIDGYHGDANVFDRTLDELRARVEPLRLRAQVASRRAWQAMAGRERLDAARRMADAQLRELLDHRALLPTVANFLCDVWRQALVRAWLREGAESSRYREMLAVGRMAAQVDGDAAVGLDHTVADRLLQLETALRDCYVACGLDERAANDSIAMLVAEVAQPDATRRVHVAEPLYGGDGLADPQPVENTSAPVLGIGQAFIYRSDPASAQAGASGMRLVQALRLVGVSELSRRYLFAGSGGEQVVLEAEEVVRCLRDGRLVARAVQDPVESVMQRLVSDDSA